MGTGPVSTLLAFDSEGGRPSGTNEARFSATPGVSAPCVHTQRARSGGSCLLWWGQRHRHKRPSCPPPRLAHSPLLARYWAQSVLRWMWSGRRRSVSPALCQHHLVQFDKLAAERKDRIIRFPLSITPLPPDATRTPSNSSPRLYARAGRPLHAEPGRIGIGAARTSTRQAPARRARTRPGHRSSPPRAQRSRARAFRVQPSSETTTRSQLIVSARINIGGD